MLFSSISFIYYFLPLVIVLYFAVPGKLKNFILLLASLAFYFYGEPVYCALLILSSLSGYVHGLWIARTREGRWRRIALISSIVFVLTPLLYFKYTGFFLLNLNRLFSEELTLLNIILPLGISFYSFQILSYTIDLYRGRTQVQRNFIDFAAYVALFPQLIAGPIVRYKTIELQLSRRSHSFADFAWGVNRFIIGLGKKVLLANTLAELGEIFADLEPKTIVFYWLTAAAFMLQIYFDFSGYSDMALGLGRMFGFRLPENFNYPYIARSITDFWRRWHISLGAWFRDYLYIPLGGNRVPALRWVGNIFVTWLLIGLWHGAQWNFVLWGLLFALLLCLEKYGLKKLLSRLPVALSHLYVLSVVLLSFVMFSAPSVGQGFADLGAMFGLSGLPLTSPETAYYLRSYGLVLLLAAVGATGLLPTMLTKVCRCQSLLSLLQPAALIGLLLLVTGYLIDGSFNPFLYFRF